MMRYEIQLQHFEGPLDLLLYFIKRDELDIMDIPISKITKDYLDYMSQIDSLNVSVAGEFIVMAATLMRIKAKMLLPNPILDDIGEIEDPRTELVHQLLEYQRYKEVAKELEQKLMEHSRLYPIGVVPKAVEDDGDINVYLEDVTLFQIAQVYQSVMNRLSAIRYYEPKRQLVSVRMKIEYILAKLKEKSRFTFNELFTNFSNRLDIIASFLAILEMAKTEMISIQQSEAFADIFIQGAGS